MRRIELFNVPISITSESGALAIITQWVMKWREARSAKHEALKIFPHASRLMPRAAIVTTPNPEMIVVAQKDPEFLKALQDADLAIPDGWGVVAAMRLLQGKRKKEKGKRKDASFPSSFCLLPSAFERISGLSLMEDLVSLAAQRGWRVMLVGGKPGIAAKAVEVFRRTKDEGRRTKENKEIPLALGPRPSALTIHALSGPSDILHASSLDLNHLITSINKVKPDLLFVAFGHGKQEKWLSANRHLLHAGVAMGVGGALDQIVDPSLRSPAIIDSIGLGWLYRLLREPWRVRRQLALVKFTAMVFRVFVRRI